MSTANPARRSSSAANRPASEPPMTTARPDAALIAPRSLRRDRETLRPGARARQGVHPRVGVLEMLAEPVGGEQRHGGATLGKPPTQSGKLFGIARKAQRQRLVG